MNLPVLLLDPYRPDAADEAGLPCGQLLTPLTRYRRTAGVPWAIDNGAYARFDRQAFLSLLDRERADKSGCLWVAVPDVPGSARRTLEVFQRWAELLATWPLALVAQDGQEDLELPWDQIAAVFIGGTSAWKCSHCARSIAQAAHCLNKLVHMGRVNTPQRLALAIRWGVDSVDGTGVSRYSWMRQALARCVADERPLLENAP